MPSHRLQRVAEAIREVVSTAILFDVADPRVKGVTVLQVDVSSDLRNATIFVSIMGSDAEQRRALEGLRHASGFIQAKVAARLQTRFTPAIQFKRDDSVKKSIEIGRLIDEALASDRRPSGSVPQENSEDQEFIEEDHEGAQDEDEEDIDDEDDDDKDD